MVPSNARCWFCHMAEDYYIGDGQTLDMLKDHGPVVQSIVSLTSSLRGQLVKCFATL